MIVTHKLKIGQQYLENLKDGRKKVEIRLNDRDYQVGDWLEFGPNIDEKYRITHIHSGLGMQDGYVALSVEKMSLS